MLLFISCYFHITCIIKIHEDSLRNSEEIHRMLPHGYNVWHMVLRRKYDYLPQFPADVGPAPHSVRVSRGVNRAVPYLSEAGAVGLRYRFRKLEMCVYRGRKKSQHF